MTHERRCSMLALRALEVLWRARGGFDAADFCRQAADCIESGGVHWPPPARMTHTVDHLRDGSDRS